MDCRSFQPFHYHFLDSVAHWEYSILRQPYTFDESPEPIDVQSLFQAMMLYKLLIREKVENIVVNTAIYMDKIECSY